MRFDIAECNSRGWLTRHGAASCMHAMNVKNASAWVPERTLSLSTWISTLRDPFNPWHNASIQLWVERTQVNQFFIPQAAYMHGVEACNVTTEVHFLCAEALTTGLALLIGKHSAFTLNVTRHRRSSEMSNHSRAAAWKMSDADRLFVRRCMFPFDTQLHDDLCRNGNGVVSFVVPPRSGRCNK